MDGWQKKEFNNHHHRSFVGNQLCSAQTRIKSEHYIIIPQEWDDDDDDDGSL
jgi:hypothetical protein